MTRSQQSSIEKIVKQKMADYLTAMNNLDSDLISSFYIDRPEFRVFTDGQSLNRDELIALVKDLKSTLQRFEGEWNYIDVTPLGESVALAAARFTRKLTDIDGNTVRDWGTVTWVWTHDGSEWRLIHGQAVHYPEGESSDTTIQ